MYATNYRNWIVYVKIIASQSWDVFLRHSVVQLVLALGGQHKRNNTLKSGVLLQMKKGWGQTTGYG